MNGVSEDRVKLWIQALRSGEYTQAKGYLETTVDKGEVSVTGNCCLGVAMHVALDNGWTPKDLIPLDWGATAMDDEAAQWFGFDDLSINDPSLGVHETPGVDENGNEVLQTSIVHCVEANDDLSWTFEQIADALEKEYITPESIEQES